MTKHTIYKIVNENTEVCLVDATTNSNNLNDELERHTIGGSSDSVYEMDTDCIVDVDIAIAFYHYKYNDGEYVDYEMVETKRCTDISARVCNDINWITLATIEFEEPNDACIDWIYQKNNKQRKTAPKTTKVKCPICGFLTMQKNLKRHQSNSRCKKRQLGIKPKDPNQKIECIYCGFRTHPCNMKRHQQSSNCICVSLLETK